MQGQYSIVNSALSLKNVIADITAAFLQDKWLRIKIDSGKRTLSQNALKSVWYKDIADFRGDMTSKDVERECKLNYGVPILRRDVATNWVYEQSLDKLPHEKKLIVMDRFAVTSLMSVKEKKEYLTCMQSDYPFLSNEA